MKQRRKTVALSVLIVILINIIPHLTSYTILIGLIASTLIIYNILQYIELYIDIKEKLESKINRLERNIDIIHRNYNSEKEVREYYQDIINSKQN